MATVPARRRLPKQARRAAILDAARAALAESGYEGAAMDDIARHAGVSKTLVYHHFPNRQAVILALLDTEHTRLLERFTVAISGGRTAREKLDRSVATFFEAVDQYGPAFPRFFGEMAAHDPEFGAKVAQIRDGVTRAVAAVFAAEAPASAEGERLLAARMLTGGVEAAAELWRTSPPEVRLPRDRAAAHVSALAWRGLAIDERDAADRP